MAEKKVTVVNTLGLHVRPVAMLAGTAARFSSAISILKEGQTANAKSSVDLLTLAAVVGSTLTIRAHGSDADAAVDALAHLFENKFGEE